MNVRDATPPDADEVATLLDRPVAAVETLLQDRTVRVAEDGGTLVGAVAFDVQSDAVHVSRLAGRDREVTGRLLAEPIGFAAGVDLAVELLVPDGEDALRAAVESRGFERTDAGPRFEGRATDRYRLDDAAGATDGG